MAFWCKIWTAGQSDPSKTIKKDQDRGSEAIFWVQNGSKMAKISIFFLRNITKPNEITFNWWALVSYNLIMQNYKIKREIYQVLVVFGPKMTKIDQNWPKIGETANFESLI